LYKIIYYYFIANRMRTKGGGKVEEYQLGLKIQLSGIRKKDCISNRKENVTGLQIKRIQEMELQITLTS
jgi:hypothetical protein